MNIPISVFIIAKDEADRIDKSIGAVVDWVDEVVVIDSGSTDRTPEVAEDAGARVIHHDWEGFGRQKLYAESECRNNWVFNIDADEIVTSELRNEIVALFADGTPNLVAYGMPVPLVYPGWSKPRKMARDHWCVRLYDRRLVHFRASPIHDSVVTSGHTVGKLQSPLLHYSIRSFQDLSKKLDERTWLAVGVKSERSSPMSLRLLTELPVNFLKYYIGRRHCLGGITGLRYAAIYAWFRFLRVYRNWRFHGLSNSPRPEKNPSS